MSSLTTTAVTSDINQYKLPTAIPKVVLAQLKIPEMMSKDGLNQMLIDFSSEHNLLYNLVRDGLIGTLERENQLHLVPIEYISESLLMDKVDKDQQFYCCKGDLIFSPDLDRLILSQRLIVIMQSLPLTQFNTLAEALAANEDKIRLFRHQLEMLSIKEPAQQPKPTLGSLYSAPSLKVQVKILTRFFAVLTVHNIYGILQSSTFKDSYNDHFDRDEQGGIVRDKEGKIARVPSFTLNPDLEEVVRYVFLKFCRNLRAPRPTSTDQDEEKITPEPAGSFGGGLAAGSVTKVALSNSQRRFQITSDIKSTIAASLQLFEKDQRRASSFGMGSSKLERGQPGSVRSNSTAVVHNIAAALIQRQAAESVLKPGEFALCGGNNRELLAPALQSLVAIYETQSKSWSNVLADLCKGSSSQQIQTIPSSFKAQDMILAEEEDRGFSANYKIISPAKIFLRAIGRRLDLVSTDAQKELAVKSMTQIRLPICVELDAFTSFVSASTKWLNVVELDLRRCLTREEIVRVTLTWVSDIDTVSNIDLEMRSKRRSLVKMAKCDSSLRDIIEEVSNWVSELTTERAEAVVFGTLSSDKAVKNQRKSRYGTEPNTDIGSIFITDARTSDAIIVRGKGSSNQTKSSLSRLPCFSWLRKKVLGGNEPGCTNRSCRFPHDVAITDAIKKAFSCPKCKSFLCNGAHPIARLQICEQKMSVSSASKQAGPKKGQTLLASGGGGPAAIGDGLSYDDLLSIIQSFPGAREHMLAIKGDHVSPMPALTETPKSTSGANTRMEILKALQVKAFETGKRTNWGKGKTKGSRAAAEEDDV
jgi:hypothetical protein